MSDAVPVATYLSHSVPHGSGSASVDPQRAAKRGGVLTISAQAIKLLLQLTATAILARLLSPADFGLISLIMPLVAFFTVFRDVGLTSATIFSEDITDAEVSSLFWINVCVGFLLAGLVLLLAPLAAAFYADPRLTQVLMATALSFVFNGASAQYLALLQRRFHFKTLVLIDVSANFGGTAIGLLAAWWGLSYWSLVLMPIATQGITLLVSALVSTWQPGKPRWEGRTGAMTRFGSAIAGFNLLNYFSRNLDNLLIGKIWGMEALGYYGRAYSLMMAPLSQVIYPLNQVVVPVLTRVNADRVVYARTYTSVMQMLMLACVPLVTCLLVGREWVVAILLGPRWSQAVPIFLALGFSAFVQPMNNSAGWLMLSQGRSRDIFLWGFIGGGFTVASILVGLPFGGLAVAISYSAVQISVVTPLLWWFSCRNQFMRVTDMFAIAWPIWLVSAAAGSSFEWFKHKLLSQYISTLTPLLGLALACVWVLTAVLILLALFSQGRNLLRMFVRALLNRRRGVL